LANFEYAGFQSRRIPLFDRAYLAHTPSVLADTLFELPGGGWGMNDVQSIWAGLVGSSGWGDLALIRKEERIVAAHCFPQKTREWMEHFSLPDRYGIFPNRADVPRQSVELCDTLDRRSWVW
jgi:hypothetical protein